MKKVDQWYSHRLRTSVSVSRWGEIGVPVLMFPTAGGDSEEIERFLVVDTLADALAGHRIKLYSCDSVAGRAMVREEGSPAHRMAVMNQFLLFVYHELVPAIRTDCRDSGIEVVVTGSSIGAFYALASLCRFPDVFRSALCMSGTYDLQRFMKGPMTADFVSSSPLHFLPEMDEGAIEALRRRFVLLASGEGKAEDIGESWRVASVLGSRGIPNRVDSWGPDWSHDWPTWRNMLVRYVDELVGSDSSGDGGSAESRPDSPGA